MFSLERRGKGTNKNSPPFDEDRLWRAQPDYSLPPKERTEVRCGILTFGSTYLLRPSHPVQRQ